MTPIDKIAWVLIQNKRVLYVRSKGKELFYNPGGKRERAETDIQALVREVKEELDVHIVQETVQYLETFSAQAAGKPDGVQVTIACYEADYTGTLTPSSEIEELAWFTSADMHRTSATGQLILGYLQDKGRVR